MSRYPTTKFCNGALLEAFEPTTRETDVFCSTTAKCGQTWLLQLVHHLRCRGEDPNPEHRSLLDVVPWLEHPLDIGNGRAPYVVPERLASLTALESPRLFKMHVVYEELPRPPGSRAPILTVTRDPRDVPYSMFRHLRGMDEGVVGKTVDDDFDKYFNVWMKLGFYFKFVRSFWPHRDDGDLLWLRYEDMQRDLRAQAVRIVDFLGWDLDDADIDRALPFASFTHMQATEHTHVLGPNASTSWRDGERFIREGGVGKNRARLSPEQEARIVERCHAEFEPSCAEFVLSLDA